jgi:enediyne biosynthesis protein E4
MKCHDPAVTWGWVAPLLAIQALCSLSGCDREPSPPGAAPTSPASVAASKDVVVAYEKPAMPSHRIPDSRPDIILGSTGASAIYFRDASEASGIRFVHTSGNSPEKEFPTCLGSGVAMLDYDGDGWLDLYFATTRNLPLTAPNASTGNRLYRNRHDGTFEDVTERAGVGFHGFTHGLAVGDIDNDGDPDLYLTNLGPNVLFLNNGNGTFRDATAGSGLDCPAWSCGAAFLDFDRDGKLDLYVSNYGEWSPDAPKPYCGDQSKNLRTICSPTLIAPRRHALFHNLGGGRFEEVSARAGVARRDGRGLGVIAADLNRDSKTDLFVANDKCPNFLFLNRGDGTFEDVSLTSGAAGGEAGELLGNMGIDAEDLDGDGWPELVATTFRGDGTALYQNLKEGNFLHISSSAGLVVDSKPYVGWGTALADFDGDGWLDLLVVNGHVDDNLPLFGQDIPQAEPAKIWRNEGVVRNRIIFKLVPQPGPYFAVPHVARGAAFGDIDNDGDIDVVINQSDQRPAILINDSPPAAWIRFSLVGHRSNRSAIGATVEVHAGGHTYYRQVKGGGSYLSANDPRILVGLGNAFSVDRVEVSWPSGMHSTLESQSLRQTHVIHEPTVEGDIAPSSVSRAKPAARRATAPFSKGATR